MEPPGHHLLFARISARQNERLLPAPRLARTWGFRSRRVGRSSLGYEAKKLEKNHEKNHRNHASHSRRRHAGARWRRGGSEERVYPRRLGHALLGRWPEPAGARRRKAAVRERRAAAWPHSGRDTKHA